MDIHIDADLDKLTDDELVALLDRDPAVIAAKMDLAAQAVEYWKSIAPKDSGDYRESIHVQRDGDTVYAVSDDPAAHIIEYGSIDTPEYGCRARTEEYFRDVG